MWGMPDVTRRVFLSASAALQVAAPKKLRAGLIGVGSRGRQAVNDLLTGAEDVEVVAMADIFEDQLEKNLKWLKNDKRNAAIAARVNVAPDRRFVGFDAFRKVLASDIDIVMLCTPPGYRPMHFEAAVEANKHIFCEKPFGTDPVGVRRFMAAAKKSEELKLTVVSGAQRRFNRGTSRRSIRSRTA
jgi:predicted dehydrogenase